MPLDLTALTSTITDIETTEASAIALMDALFADFEKNKNNPAEIQALVDRGRAAQAKLAAAVATDTPPASNP